MRFGFFSPLPAWYFELSLSSVRFEVTLYRYLVDKKEKNKIEKGEKTKIEKGFLYFQVQCVCFFVLLDVKADNIFVKKRIIKHQQF
jgi:hypothetical protein